MHLFHYAAYARCQNHLVTYIFLDLIVECLRLTLQKKVPCVRYFCHIIAWDKFCDLDAYLLAEEAVAI
jgi:hypothetical protein